MTSTTPTHVDTSIPEIWAKDSLRKVKRDGFWGRFVGGPGAPIVQKAELLNNPGDQIHIQVTDVLSGAGQTGDTSAVVGNEENLATSEIKAAPLQYRHGVRVWQRADKKSILDLREESRFRLEEWMRDKIDSVRFNLLTATSLPAPLGSETYAPNIYVPGGAPYTVDGVAVGDKITVQALQEIKLKLTLQMAKPIMVDGFPHYVFVTHPYATFQLKQEARYESWVREARERGPNNPFFRGALAVIDGVIIYEHASVPTVVNATSVNVAKGIAFGAEMAVEALDENVNFEEDTFDYNAEYGMAVNFAFQPRRALELSSTQVYASAPVI